MRSFIFLVACLASLNSTWAKDEFLLRNLIPADYGPLMLDSSEPGPTIAVLLYSTESGKWLPPLTWENPRNLLEVTLESSMPHFVRLVYKEQKVDLGYVDFHRLVADQKQPPILALYVAKQMRVLPENQEVTKRVVEVYTQDYEVPVPVTKPITREVEATNPTTGQPANFAVTLPVQTSVMQQRNKTTTRMREIQELAPAGTVIEDERLALGVQELLAIDQESLEPAVERANKPALAAKLPADQATFRLLQVTPPGTTFAIEPTPNVWLYSTKDKEWRNAVSMDKRGLSDPLPLKPGLHFLNLSTTTYNNNLGYVDFAAVSKEQKDPLFVLETLKERLQVRQGQEYLRSVPSFEETTETYTVQVPVMMTKPVTIKDPNTGETVTREVHYTQMIPEQRTTVRRRAMIKTEKAKAARDETIDHEMPRLSFLREPEVDRKRKAPVLAHPTPEPEAFRAKVSPIATPLPAGLPSYAPPAPVPLPVPLPAQFLPPLLPEGLPAPDVSDY